MRDAESAVDSQLVGYFSNQAHLQLHRLGPAVNQELVELCFWAGFFGTSRDVMVGFFLPSGFGKARLGHFFKEAGQC
jgi:hypothetical protein